MTRSTFPTEMPAPQVAYLCIRRQPSLYLRGHVGNPTEILVKTTPVPLLACPPTVREGIDDVLNTVAPACDDVTGLGVPWVPSPVEQ